MTYRSDIDGLRAIAVLMVLLFHFDLTGSYGAGFLGVDVFFVISGFLITSIILQEMNDGRFSLTDFYLKRVRRLAPAFFATLLGVLVFGFLWLFPADFSGLVKEMLSAQFYVSNIFYWRTINYFGLLANSAFLLHTWSLAVEEQFYLVYPLALAVVHRHFRARLWYFVFAAALISFSLNVLMVERKPEATFYLFPTRAWELLIGAGAVWICQQKRVIDQFGSSFGWLGLLAIGISFVGLNSTYRFPGWVALVPTMGAAGVLASGATTRSGLSRVLGFKPLVYIGRISYPLYLVHWPILIFAKYEFDPNLSLISRMLLLVLSLVAAAFIFHMVEQPIRSSTHLRRSSRLAIMYASLLAGSASLCLAVLATAGVPWRYPADVLAVAAYANDKTEEMPQCEFQSQISEASLCLMGDATSKPTWLIYGDSHAWATYHAFDGWLKDIHASAYFVFMHSCPPVRGVHLYHDKDRCFAFNEAVFAFLKETPDIRDVFLISVWRQAIDGLSTSDQSVADPITSVALFEREFPAMIRDLNASGKSVFLWEPLPGARKSVPQAMAAAELRGGDLADLEFSQREYLETFDFFFKTVAQSNVAGTLSTSDALCSSGTCTVRDDQGHPIYFDDDHPTKSSSAFWRKRLNELKAFPNAGR